MYENLTPNLMVKSVFESLKFYEEMLGFQKVLTVPETGEDLQFAILKKDNITLMFQEQKNLIQEYPSLDCEEIKPCLTLFITVSNVLEMYDILKEKVQLASELHKTFYGKNEFAIFDNNGFILTLAD